MSDIEVERCSIRGEFSAPLIGKYSGDYSFAGMFFARAALDSSVICTNLSASSEQNGKIVLDILRAFGAKITRGGDSVNVRANGLRGCSVDVSEFPKLAPVIALLALFAKGKSHISGMRCAPELQALIIENLSLLGAKCEFNDDNLWMWPQRSVEHTVLNARNDPYMALALILISTYTAGTTCIRNVDGLFERYPEFTEIFEKLGGVYRVCRLSL